ncbi:YkvI family membrane protein [Effusibacillus dendaii]|uniref:Membrane protein n=1 Tax=Effusibacillus dendaii TaxID=2743772 RepID=A0A7I8D5Z4_9BACL|nr:hypothetical protein [Effusibacillus dendaii]BCJ85417.1 membrane protein [Effusibacillus dendaii]
MQKQQIKQSLQIGFTYIGTVVGAGFASGQEILQFFTVYGEWSYLGILISVLLFAWVGGKMLLLGAKLKANSYRELNAYLFGERLALWIDLFMLVMLFGVTVAMLAGVGALFDENFQLPFELGVLVTMAATYFTIMRGMQGILAANTIIVPVMMTLVCFIFLKTAWTTGMRTSTVIPQPSGSWLTSAISYAAFNLGLASSVLVPLGNEIKDRKTLVLGGCVGSVGLGIMLLGANFALTTHFPTVLNYQVPMAFLISTSGALLQTIFVLVLWGEIFSTLIANVYGLGSQLIAPYPAEKGPLLIVLILTSAFFVSQIGFTKIVTYLYPIFGYLSFLLMTLLLWPHNVQKRS